MSLATTIAATRQEASFWALAPWLALILAIGVAVGVANALVVSLLELQPFVVTLGTWSVTQGIALMILPADGGLVPSAWFDLAYKEPLGVPTPVWLLAATVLAWSWARRTRTITRIRAAGSNERAATLSGVSPLRANLAAYSICGLLAALAGFVFAAQTSAGSPVVGAQFVLPAIAAVVIGGANLAGGQASVIGTIIGAFVLNLIGDVVFQLRLASYWQPVASGVVLVVVVAASYFSRTAAGRARA